MEEKYWQYVRDGDVEKYLSLWHDDFVGWPGDAVHPSRKANIGYWVRAIRDQKIDATYVLAFGRLAAKLNASHAAHPNSPAAQAWERR